MGITMRKNKIPKNKIKEYNLKRNTIRQRIKLEMNNQNINVASTGGRTRENQLIIHKDH
jgi:hypothetical protein